MKRLVCLTFLILGLAACSDSEPNATSSTQVDPNPQLDADPTPDSGTGGETEAATPDATVNGAPGGKALENQPTPTD
jgi:hypothetical protein